MKKVLKNKCSLEEEYAFEHKQRIKAEKYIEELWEYNSELTKEVKKLQEVINKGEHLPKEKTALDRDLELRIRMDKVYKSREKAITKWEKKLK
jgi:predicted RNase H-like nuclease (RuvC/YqgF family)